MTEQTYTDIDYEHMDDLPLSQRAEWSFLLIDGDIADHVESDHVELTTN